MTTSSCHHLREGKRKLKKHTMGGRFPMRVPHKERKLSRCLMSIPVAICVYGLAYNEGATDKALCLSIAVICAAVMEIDMFRTKPRQAQATPCTTPDS